MSRAGRASHRLVASRSVYAVRQHGVWLVVEARSGATLPVSPLLDACLDACADPRTPDEIARRLTAWPRPVVSRLVTALEAAGVLVEAELARAEAWDPWSPVADWYHFSTRDVPVQKGRQPDGPPPPPTRRYRTAMSVALPLPTLHGIGLARALAHRRTWRRFGERRLTIEAAGTLLGSTFGIQSWVDAPTAGRTALKTSPSGGARHSVEAYVCVRRVEGVPAGLYHYRPDLHRLDRLRAGCTSRDLARFLPEQPGYRKAAMVCLLATELARVRWRYRHARAYRVVLIEAGHLAQTFALVAAGLGLAAFTSGALADSVVEETLGLSSATSPVLYACGAGVAPRGIAWAPYADAAPPARRPTRLGRRLRGEGR